MNDGKLGLFDLVAQGNALGIRHLVEAGADPNSTGEFGNTVLYSACFRDQPVAVQALLDSGADPNLRMTYRSPVDGRVETGIVALMACRSLETVEALLRAGADPNVSDDAGFTPLMRAALAAPALAVARLLEFGADPKARNADGVTAVDLVKERLTLHSDGSASPRRRNQLERILQLIEGSQGSVEQGAEADEAPHG